MFADTQRSEYRGSSFDAARSRTPHVAESSPLAPLHTPSASHRTFFLFVVVSFLGALLLTFWCLSDSGKMLDSRSHRRSTAELLPMADRPGRP